jgi:hypothetical protein
VIVLHRARPMYSRAGVVLFGALVSGAVVCAATQAPAENLFEALFGNFGRPSAPQSRPDASPPEPRSTVPEAPAEGHGRSAAFCVRMCDGRYFPMQHQSGVNPTQLCTSLCPASPTKVFWGNEIIRAIAGDGTRYSATENALVYRKRLVPGCTCNGTTTFGLAPIATGDDPTVRPGDIQTPGGGRPNR